MGRGGAGDRSAQVFSRAPHLITHSGCLDGTVCVLLFRLAFGISARVTRCDHDQVDAVVLEHLAEPDPAPLLIVDISVTPETADMLDAWVRSGLEVTLLDHHTTAQRLAGRRWARIDESACGAQLLAEALGSDQRYAELVTLTDDYDRWVHRDPRSRELARLLSLLGTDVFMRRFSGDPSCVWTPEERRVLDEDRRAFERYVDALEGAALRTELPGGAPLVVAEATRYISDAAEELGRRTGAHVIALLNPRTGRVSVRSRGQVDVAGICERLGGGGHPGAAGFPLHGERPGLDAIAARIIEAAAAA